MEPSHAASRFVLVLQLVALAAWPGGLAAQDWIARELEAAPPEGPPRLDLAFGVGASFSTDWSEQVVLETQAASGARTARLLLPELAMAPGRSLAGAVTYWRGFLGVRFQGAFARACVTAGETRCDRSADRGTAVQFATDLDLWTYGVEALVGLPPDRVSGPVRPYLLIGGAGMTFDPAEPVPAPGLPEGETTGRTGDEEIIVVDGPTNLVLTVDRLGFETRLALELGAGLDLRLPLGRHGIGLRLEVVDALTNSPVGVRIARLGGDVFDGGLVAIETERPLVHTFRATIGAIIDVGLPTPPPSTVAAVRP